jgi:hypothetical protein
MGGEELKISMVGDWKIQGGKGERERKRERVREGGKGKGKEGEGRKEEGGGKVI